MRQLVIILTALWVMGYMPEATIRLVHAWGWIDEMQMQIILSLPTE